MVWAHTALQSSLKEEVQDWKTTSERTSPSSCKCVSNIEKSERKVDLVIKARGRNSVVLG